MATNKKAVCKRIFERAAKVLQKEPGEVTYNQFVEHSKNEISKHWIRRYGFLRLRGELYGTASRCNAQREEVSFDQHLSTFKNALQRIADQLGKSPRFVSYDEFNDNQPGIGRKTIGSILGGYANAKDKAFPPEPFPLQFYKQFDAAQLRNHIKTMIEECGKTIGMASHDISWPRFSNYIGFRYGTNSVGIAKFAISDAGGYYLVRHSCFSIQPTPLTVNKFVSQRVAADNKKEGQFKASTQALWDGMRENAERIFADPPPVIFIGRKEIGTSEAILNLQISDTHIGSDISKKKTGSLDFGPKEESRRLAHVAKTTVRVRYVNGKPIRRLNVFILGDLIEGKIHYKLAGALLSEQHSRAVRIFTFMLRYFSEHFDEIHVICLSGNHDRLTEMSPGRAYEDKSDSYATMIYTGIMWGCANLKNVTFEIPLSPTAIVTNFDQKILATHGDTVVNTGQPGRKLDIEKLEKQTNTINASFPDAEEVKAVVTGHIHVGTNTFANNGCKIITNPPLVPIGGFALGLGVHEAACGQNIFESRPGEAVWNYNVIKVGIEQDEDENLDAIIPPWKGLDRI